MNLKDPETISFVAYILVFFGAINWGLIGLIKLNIVQMILGGGFLARIIYIVIGVAAGYLIYMKYINKKIA